MPLAWASQDSLFPQIFSAKVMLPPKLITPFNGSEMPPLVQFRWTSIDRAALYELQVTLKTDPGFSRPKIKKFISSVSYAPELPLDTGSYIWRVRGRNRMGVSSWSSTFSFEVLDYVVSVFSDDFSSYNLDCSRGGTGFGPWLIVYSGYG